MKRQLPKVRQEKTRIALSQRITFEKSCNYSAHNVDMFIIAALW
jgi:hypothetical protein